MSCQKVYINQMHSNTLSDHLTVMWKEEVLCDAVVLHDNGVVKVHRIVLRAACPRLQAKDSSAGSFLDVKIPSGVSENSVMAFLSFLYEGILTLSVQNVKEIWAIATEFEISNLQKCCKDFVSNYYTEKDISLIDDSTMDRISSSAGLCDPFKHFKTTTMNLTSNSDEPAQDSRLNIKKRKIVDNSSDNSSNVSTQINVDSLSEKSSKPYPTALISVSNNSSPIKSSDNKQMLPTMTIKTECVDPDDSLEPQDLKFEIIETDKVRTYQGVPLFSASRVKNRYSDAQKEEIKEEALQYGIKYVSMERNIPSSTIGTWLAQDARYNQRAYRRKSQILKKSKNSEDQPDEILTVYEQVPSVEVDYAEGEGEEEEEESPGHIQLYAGEADPNELLQAVSARRGHYARYSREEKEETVRDALERGISVVSKEKKIPCSTIQTWTTQFKKTAM